MAKLVGQPMVWGWGFVAVWLGHSAYTLVTMRWTGLVISLVGLVAALLIMGAIQSRRRKNLYPGRNHSGQQALKGQN